MVLPVPFSRTLPDPISQRRSYAPTGQPGTVMEYDASVLSPYARTTRCQVFAKLRCPVLTQRMLLSAYALAMGCPVLKTYCHTVIGASTLIPTGKRLLQIRF
eukprot:3941523-Rhodomonas_salina.3